MKKILSMLVVVSVVVLSAMGAFAADYLPDDNGRYTVVVEGLQAGEMYGMVAIKGTQASQITEANIVYIDQATADAEGKITFTSFGTMGAAPDSADFTEATVFVGGAGLSSATVVGTLKAAESDEPAVIPVTGISLNDNEETLDIGATYTLVATVTPNDATDKTVTWESSAPAIAEVVDGVVTAKAAGEATITAKAGDKTATCTIKVNEAAPQPPADAVLGDITGDKNVDIQDATYLFNYTMNPRRYPIDSYPGKVDYNKDGNVDIQDATYLFNYSMNPRRYPIEW